MKQMTKLENIVMNRTSCNRMIANLVANDTCSFADEEIDKLLGEQYISMLLFEINRGNIDKQVLDNANKNRLIMKGDL